MVAATANVVNTLIGANIFIRLGAAGLLSFPIIVGELISNNMRGPASGLIFVTSAPIAVFGPIVARSFIKNFEQKWHWNYHLGVIPDGVALILFFFYHPPTYEQLHLDGKSKRKQLLHFDCIGSLLPTTVVVLFLIDLNWVGGVYPWTSAHILATLLVGVLIIAAFCLWEIYGPSTTPLIPMRVVKNGKYDAILACAYVGTMVSYSSIIWPSAISALYTTELKYAGRLAVRSAPVLLFNHLRHLTNNVSSVYDRRRPVGWPNRWWYWTKICSSHEASDDILRPLIDYIC